MLLRNLLNNIHTCLGNFSKKALLVGVLGTFYICGGWATDYYWCGGSSGDWNTATNWSTTAPASNAQTSGNGAVPGSSDTAFITYATTINVDSNVTVTKLNIPNPNLETSSFTVSLTGSNSLTVSDTIETVRAAASGAAADATSTLIFNCNVTAGQLIMHSGGNITIGSSSTANITNIINTGAGSTPNTVLNVSGTLVSSTIALSDVATRTLLVDSGATLSTGTLTGTTNSVTNNGTVVAGTSSSDIINDSSSSGTTATGSGGNVPFLWKGTTDTDWANATNWFGGAVPDSTTAEVCIAASSNPPVISGTVNVKSITFASDTSAKLTVSGSLTVNEAFSLSSKIDTSSAGTLITTGALTVSEDYSATGLSLQADTVTASANLSCKTISVTGAASFSKNLITQSSPGFGGTVTIDGSTDQMFLLTGGATISNPVITKTGGYLLFHVGAITLGGSNIDSGAESYGPLILNSVTTFTGNPVIQKATYVKVDTGCTSINGSGTKSFQTKVSFESGTTVTVAPDLIVSGDFTDSGTNSFQKITLNGNDGTGNGKSTQILSPSAASTYTNLTVQKTNDTNHIVKITADSTLNGNLTLKAGTLTVDSGKTFTITGTGIFTVEAGYLSGIFNSKSLTVSGDCNATSDSTFITDSINLNAKITGTSSATLKFYPATAGNSIYIGDDAASQFSLSATELNNLSGKKIIIGENSTNTDNIIINNSFTVDYPLDLLTKGSISASGDYDISAKTHELTLNAAAGIGSSTQAINFAAVQSGNIKALNSTSGDLYINLKSTSTAKAGGNLTVTNSNGNISIITAGAFEIGTNLSTSAATGSITINAATTITRTSGTLTAATVNLSAPDGIGTSGSSVFLAADTIAAAASSSGSIYLSNSKNAGYNVSSAGGQISIDNAGTLSVGTGKAISTTNNNVTVKATGFSFTDTPSVIAGTGNITITSHASGSQISLKDSDFAKLNTSGGLLIGDSSHTGNVLLTNDSGTGTLPADTTVTGGTFTLQTGMDANGKNLTINANLDLSAATFNANNGTVIINANNSKLTVKADKSTTFNNLKIEAGKTLTCNGEFNISGNWTNNGTYAGTGSTVHFSGTSEVNGTAVTTFNNVTIDSGQSLKSNVTASEGNLINLSGQWTNAAGSTAFDANSGTVSAIDSASFYGESTFYNLSCTTAGKTLTFEAGKTQTISNKLTLKGSTGNLLKLRSATTGTSWTINCTGSNSHDIQYVDIQDSNNDSSSYSTTSGGYRLTATKSVDSKNNYRWNFPAYKYTWTGASSPANTNWFDQTNWDRGSVPGLGAEVIIPVTTNKPKLEQNMTNSVGDPYASIGPDGILTVESGAVLDLDTYGFSAKSINNSGRIRLSGAQTITAETVTNADNSTVEYYGTVNGTLPLKTDYYNLEFTTAADGTAGTSAEGINVRNLVTINTSGTLAINSASAVSIAPDVTASSLTITASSVTTTGGTAGTPAVLTVSGGIIINGDYINNGIITNNAVTQVNGSVTNASSCTANSNFSFTGNFTDTGTWSGTSQLILNGTGSQQFTANTAAYADIFINKTAGSTEFTNDVKIQNLTDTAASGNITFKGNTLISSNVTFNTTGTVLFGSANSNVTTFKLPASLAKMVHTTGPTTLFGTINGDLSIADSSAGDSGFVLNGSLSASGHTLSGSLFIYSSEETPSAVTLDSISITGDLIFNRSGTINTKGTISAANIVLYKGDITSDPGTSLEAAKDLVLLGIAYNIANTESGNDQEFVYQQTRLSPYNYLRTSFTGTDTSADKMPDGTVLPTVSSGFSGTYSAGAGASLIAGKNFYANGTTFTASSNWFIGIPDITNANNGFAEADYTSTIYAVIRCNADSSTDGSKACMPAYFCTDNGSNINWLFDDFKITEAHTERDNTVKITFNRSVRNLNSELINSISRFVNNADTYSGFYTDADCQNPLAAANLTDCTVYIKSDNSWNTDATGTSAGTAASTDRSGIHKEVIPYIQINKLAGNSSVHISDIWGKHIKNYAVTPFTDVTDQTGPVLYSVRTGQEVHTSYDSSKGAESQPSYDSHNFLEFRYSEKVNFGDTALATGTNITKAVYDNSDMTQGIWLPAAAATVTDGFADIANVRVKDSFGVLTNDITTEGSLNFAGLGTISSGLIYTGSKGTSDKYVNTLYRTDEYSIRLSLAGYTEGTVNDRNGNSYKNWTGYLERAVQPSGPVTLSASLNTMVTDCALALNGTTPLYNPQKQYEADQVNPSVNQNFSTRTDYENQDVYSSWDISEPVFSPLRLNTETAWKADKYFEAVGNTSGMGSTLDKIEFHLFDNTPSYSSSDTAAWLSEKGWVQNNSEKNPALYDEEYSYAADVTGGARQFTTRNRTTGGIRYSTIEASKSAFLYIDSQADTAVPIVPFDTSANGIYVGAKASLFTGSSSLRRAADSEDGLYFGLGLSQTDLPISKSFTVSYNDEKGFITDLAGNRLRSATIRTIDRTPPSYDIVLGPINQKEVNIVFVKKVISNTQDLKYLDESGEQIQIGELFETLAPRCFELISIDSEGNALPSEDIQIDYSIPAQIQSVVSQVNGQDFTIFKLSLTQNITLRQIENLYIRVKCADGYKEFSQDPITGISNSRVTFIQDDFGNYMQMFEAHSLSDFAISSVNLLYAYDADMNYDGEYAMNGLYEEGSWAVHDWNADQKNYGTLPANHPYGIVADMDDGTEAQKDLPGAIRIFLSAAPSEASVSKQYNSDLNQNLRIWLPEVTNGLFPALALENNPVSNFYQTDSIVLDASQSQSRVLFNVPKEVSEGWGPDQQISFVIGLLDSEHNPLRICTSPYYDVTTGLYDLGISEYLPLYAFRLTDSTDITSLDLWSFKTKSITEQRGGVTILNNVINATKGEKTVIKVNMPEAGKLDVIVMTLDGNIVTYLNHGQTEAGEHYYSWNGKNNNKGTVARGIYFVRITGSGIDETRKVMVVK